MRFEEHVTIGIITGGIIGLAISSLGENIDVISVFMATIFGGIGAAIPDSLEPPSSWTHRKFYHSRKMLKQMLLLLLLLLIGVPLWVNIREGYVIAGGITGYISHLLMDATTPAGLPS